MEEKELKIQVPDGYEIDKENSTFECIKFKPVKRNITYNDICYILFKDKNNFFITTKGNITDSNLSWDSAIEKNNATNKEQLERILALNQLYNIAEYYNNLHSKQDTLKYCIILEKGHDYDILEYQKMHCQFGVVVLFSSKEDAQAVVDNPNFREILDTVYKDC